MSESRLQTLYRRYADSGDLSALGSIFDAVAPDLLRLAKRLTRDAAAAEDAVQEVFLTVVERPEQFDASRPLGPWLAGMLVNRLRGEWRRAARTTGVEPTLEGSEQEPSESLRREEIDTLVRRAVAELPERERVAVAARLFDDVGSKELARRLGISAGSARIRLHRGMQRLRSLIPQALGVGAMARLSESRSLASVRANVMSAAGSPSAATGASSLGGANLWPIVAAPLLVGGVAVALVVDRSSEAEAEDETVAVVNASRADETTPRDVPLTPATGRNATRTDARPDRKPTTVARPRSRSGGASTGGGSFSGRVIDEDGIPIVGAAVREMTGVPRTLATTDSSGRFEIPELGPKFLIAAEKDGFASLVAYRGTLREDERIEALDLELARAAVLRGVVRDTNGSPVAGVAIESRFGTASYDDRLLTRYDSVLETTGIACTTTSDEFGRFELGPVPHSGRTHVWFEKAPFLIRNVFLEPNEGPHVVVLNSGLSVTGRVLAADGTPAAGARVKAGPFWSNVQTTASSVLTGTDGSFRLDGFSQPNGKSEVHTPPYLIVTHDGCAVEVVQPIRLSHTPDVDPITVRLVEGLVIEGVVKDVDGAPCEGVRLQVIGDREMKRGYDNGYPPTWIHVAGKDQSLTDDEGRFEFSELHAGSYELRMIDPTDPHRFTTRSVHAGDTDLELVLDPSAFDKAVIDGTVRDARTGDSIERFTVTSFVDGYGDSLDFESEDGSFTLRGLEPGPCELQVRSPGYAPLRVDDATLQLGLNELEFELHRSVSIPIRVVDETGALRPRARLRVLDESGKALMVTAGPGRMSSGLDVRDGRVVAHGVPACQVTLEVRWGRAQVDVALDARVPIEDEVEIVLIDPPAKKRSLTIVALQDSGDESDAIDALRNAVDATDPDLIKAWFTEPSRPFPSRRIDFELRQLDGDERAEGSIVPKESGGEFECSTQQSGSPDSSSGAQWNSPVPSIDLDLTVGRWRLTVKAQGQRYRSYVLDVGPESEATEQIELVVVGP